jgi:hypothetical protein
MIIEAVARTLNQKPKSDIQIGLTNIKTKAVNARILIARYIRPVICAKKAVEPIVEALTIGASNPLKIS